MTAELKEFLALIRAGRLFTVQSWLETKGYMLAPEPRKSPLYVAVESRFHSMVEVLAKGGATQNEKDMALFRAVSLARPDLVELLVENGASPKTISFSDVCRTENPHIVRFFEGQEPDLITGEPLLEALRNRYRAALRVCKERCASSPEIQMQADTALMHHVEEGNAKWVSLLLWAGANPHTKVDGDACSLDRAAGSENPEVFAPFRKHLRAHDLNRVLAAACRGGNITAVRELLKLGADVNANEGGTNCLQQCLVRLGWLYHVQMSYLKRLPDASECIDAILTAGGKWNVNFSTPSDSQAARQALYKSPPYVALPLIQRLYESGALGESFHRFCCTPGLKKLFRSEFESSPRRYPAFRLLYPPAR